MKNTTDCYKNLIKKYFNGFDLRYRDSDFLYFVCISKY